MWLPLENLFAVCSWFLLWRSVLPVFFALEQFRVYFSRNPFPKIYSVGMNGGLPCAGDVYHIYSFPLVTLVRIFNIIHSCSTTLYISFCRLGKNIYVNFAVVQLICLFEALVGTIYVNYAVFQLICIFVDLVRIFIIPRPPKLKVVGIMV